jgi:hypothetical protein
VPKRELYAAALNLKALLPGLFPSDAPDDSEPPDALDPANASDAADATL